MKVLVNFSSSEGTAPDEEVEILDEDDLDASGDEYVIETMDHRAVRYPKESVDSLKIE